ncbi:MAG: hypothetical protein JW743_05525 [Deltaproteobacteria bacterium]|nr:hypothetical protein [Deltaproteobacteria bacterium]MBN2845495.1 hypothetical protein [Deltaproteobacteria bacterium]
MKTAPRGSYNNTERELSRCGKDGCSITSAQRVYDNISMNGIIIGIVVAFIVWLSLRGGRRMKEKKARFKSEAEKKVIPRIGTAGTITEEQAEELRKNNFEPLKDWSFEEAALMLDTTTYLRAVFSEAADLKASLVEMQNELLVFILNDEQLRDYVRRWGEERRNRESNGEVAELPHDAEFERIAAEALRIAGKKRSSTSPA